MKLLLDTHVFMWWDSDRTRLSPGVLAACKSPANSLHLSLASVWEIQIKLQLGKLPLGQPPGQPLGDLIRDHEARNGMRLEPVMLADILALSALPAHHRDPFDRILVAQARRGGFRLVSRDPEIARYDVEVLW